MITARAAALVRCEDCGLLYHAADVTGSPDPHCSRCGSPLHARKPESLTRTWALLVAAITFYIPANVYPVMTIIFSGKGSPPSSSKWWAR